MKEIVQSDWVPPTLRAGVGAHAYLRPLPLHRYGEEVLQKVAVQQKREVTGLADETKKLHQIRIQKAQALQASFTLRPRLRRGAFAGWN